MFERSIDNGKNIIIDPVVRQHHAFAASRLDNVGDRLFDLVIASVERNDRAACIDAEGKIDCGSRNYHRFVNYQMDGPDLLTVRPSSVRFPPAETATLPPPWIVQFPLASIWIVEPLALS